jgi:hypothetical protein
MVALRLIRRMGGIVTQLTRVVQSWVVRGAVALCAFLIPLAAGAQVTNASNVSIPVLDGAGIASMAGILTMTGAWALARHRGRKR